MAFLAIEDWTGEEYLFKNEPVLEPADQTMIWQVKEGEFIQLPKGTIKNFFGIEGLEPFTLVRIDYTFIQGKYLVEILD